VPKPLQGLVAVAEFGSMWEADAATRSLADLGIEATTSYDPAINSVAPYFASDRVVEVIVREEDAERAQNFLAAGPGTLPAEFTSPELTAWSESRARRSGRPTTRWLGLRLLLILVLGAIALSALSALISAMG